MAGRTEGLARPARALRVVGQPVRKVDGLAKCTGALRYADDIILPRMLFCRILRSPEHLRLRFECARQTTKDGQA